MLSLEGGDIKVPLNSWGASRARETLKIVGTNRKSTSEANTGVEFMLKFLTSVSLTDPVCNGCK